MPKRDEPTSLARALGRIPTGLYVVATRADGEAQGFLASFLMQVGFEPPVLCVAVGRERPQLDAIRRTERFAVSVLDPDSRALMKPFLQRQPDGRSPFDLIDTADSASGQPVLPEALAWLDCRLRGEQETGDHVVVFGEVDEGRLLREGDPSIHLRRNGLVY